MYKFITFGLLYFITIQLFTESAAEKLNKRQVLQENKKLTNIGDTNWAFAGNVPTPTLGRITPSDEPAEYKQEIEDRNRRENERSRLTKRGIRDGDIDRERHWADSDRNVNNRRNHLYGGHDNSRRRISERERDGGYQYEARESHDRDRNPTDRDVGRGRTSGPRDSGRRTSETWEGERRSSRTRDGEGRRYRRATSQLEEDKAIPKKSLKKEDYSSKDNSQSNNRRYNQYGEGYFPSYDYEAGRGRGHSRYPSRGGHRGGQEEIEIEEEITITRQDKPYYK